MKSFAILNFLLVGGALARYRNPNLVANGSVKYAGINIAGFDFGCLTDGSQTLKNVNGPIGGMGGDGAGQMNHFTKDDHMNVFRLPIGWQYLTNNNVGGNLDSSALSKYDGLMQSCLKTGALCIIDIHNYARWNGKIIGQGGPTNDQFVALWKALATKYKGNAMVAFGLMNEPHEVDLTKWAETLQLVVAAIRGAGAATHLILLPGNDYTSAGRFISNGSGAALLTVTNPDGTTTGLIFDVHKYLDSDNSGTHTECVTDNVNDAFAPLATWLRTNNRQAMLTETGGGNTASCTKYMCQEIAYLNANSDVYLGYVGWAAGSFGTTYELNETPTGSGNNWQDTSLVKACLKR
ncbi:glycoside hydrolase superfamily [Halenospora varia]|nr:glycoside hydrolase superfamily [Halenospora varia]